MIIPVDTHCHTVASTHAFSTLGELVNEAKKKNMQAIAITDHTPGIPDGAHEWHFSTLIGCVPLEVEGIRIIKGAEANILNFKGELDLNSYHQKSLEIIIASVHSPSCVKPATKAEHTQMYINTLQNPYVDILGHSGNHEYEYYIDEVVEVAKENNKLIEINNHSFHERPRSVPNCIKIAEKCAEYGVGIVLSSDSHVAYSVGEVTKAWDMLVEIGFPEELIMNTSLEKFYGYMQTTNHIKYNGSTT